MHSFHLRYIHLALLVCLLFKRKSDCEVSEIRLYYEADFNSLSRCKNTAGTGFERSIIEK